jgi:hypothetical protein
MGQRFTAARPLGFVGSDCATFVAAIVTTGLSGMMELLIRK